MSDLAATGPLTDPTWVVSAHRAAPAVSAKGAHIVRLLMLVSGAVALSWMFRLG